MTLFKEYHITGTDVRGKRFRIYTKNLHHALGINLWKGSVWGVYEDGKRKLLRRVWN